MPGTEEVQPFADHVQANLEFQLIITLTHKSHLALTPGGVETEAFRLNIAGTLDCAIYPSATGQGFDLSNRVLAMRIDNRGRAHLPGSLRSPGNRLGHNDSRPPEAGVDHRPQANWPSSTHQNGIEGRQAHGLEGPKRGSQGAAGQAGSFIRNALGDLGQEPIRF